MPTPDPLSYAAEWLDSWNAHDIERVLDHFAEHAVFTSPTAVRVVPESGGVLHGKAALRAYWTRALELNPELRFELLGVSAGLDVIVITFRTQAGPVTNEVLRFENGVVVEGHATHLRSDG